MSTTARPDHIADPRPILDDTIVDCGNGIWLWRAFNVLPDETPPNPDPDTLGIRSVEMKRDAPELYGAYGDSDCDGAVLARWKPTIPEGRALCAVIDTDDGPFALHIPDDHPRVSQITQREPLAEGRDHLTTSGRFQSDRKPSVPAGSVPLSDRDPQALLPLILYAALHRAAGKHGDSAFARDLFDALIAQHGARGVIDAVGALLSTDPLEHHVAAESVLRDFSGRAWRRMT